MMEGKKQADTESILDTAARKMFAAVMITSFIGPFATSGINVAIPSLAQEFGASAGELSWVVFGFLLVAIQTVFRVFGTISLVAIFMSLVHNRVK